jgi:hypothetical protein
MNLKDEAAFSSKMILHSKKKLAEREGFEPPVRFPVHLISSLVTTSPNHQRPAKTYRKMVPLSPLPCL